MSISHGESSKISSENGKYKIGDERYERTDEKADVPSTSGAEAMSTSRTRIRIWRRISDSESEEDSFEPMRKVADSKSKVNK